MDGTGLSSSSFSNARKHALLLSINQPTSQPARRLPTTQKEGFNFVLTTLTVPVPDRWQAPCRSAPRDRSGWWVLPQPLRLTDAVRCLSQNLGMGSDDHACLRSGRAIGQGSSGLPNVDLNFHLAVFSSFHPPPPSRTRFTAVVPSWAWKLRRRGLTVRSTVDTCPGRLLSASSHHVV